LTYGASAVPSGFGRFGRYNNDGLLTLNVTPYGFEAPSPMQPLSLRFAQAPAAPSQVMLNGTPVPFEFVSGLIRVSAHVQGEIKIEIQFM